MEYFSKNTFCVEYNFNSILLPKMLKIFVSGISWLQQTSDKSPIEKKINSVDLY